MVSKELFDTFCGFSRSFVSSSKTSKREVFPHVLEWDHFQLGRSLTLDKLPQPLRLNLLLCFWHASPWSTLREKSQNGVKLP